MLCDETSVINSNRYYNMRIIRIQIILLVVIYLRRQSAAAAVAGGKRIL